MTQASKQARRSRGLIWAIICLLNPTIALSSDKSSPEVTLIFSCCSSRQRRPGDLKADFRAVPYKDFPWDRQSGQAASQGCILHHTHKLLAFSIPKV